MAWEVGYAGETDEEREKREARERAERERIEAAQDAHDTNTGYDSTTPTTTTASASTTTIDPSTYLEQNPMPQDTYEVMTGQQFSDWLAGQGGDPNNWWAGYEDILNPGGEEGFDYNIYNNLPIAMMKKDAAGNYTLSKMFPETYSLYKLRTETPNQWWAQQGYNYQDISESEPYQNLGTLAQLWGSQGDMDQQMGYAGDYAARSLGFENAGAYQSKMADLQSKLDQVDFSGALNPEQERALALDIQGVREESQLMVEALAASGRSAQAFYKMDEVSRAIADVAVQGKLAYMNNNLARSQLEFNALSGRYEQLATQGYAGAEQYLQKLQEQRATTLGIYASQISALVDDNNRYVELYKVHADQVYKSIMADMGYDEHLMSQMQEAWEQSIAPWLQEYETYLSGYATEMGVELQEASNKASSGGLLTGFLQVLMMGLALIP